MRSVDTDFQYTQHGDNGDDIGYRVIREPKGGPDAVLLAPLSYEDTLIRAGNILSVVGYTARLITYSEQGNTACSAVPGELLLPMSVWLYDGAALPAGRILSTRADAAALAGEALKTLRDFNG